MKHLPTYIVGAVVAVAVIGLIGWSTTRSSTPGPDTTKQQAPQSTAGSEDNQKPASVGRYAQYSEQAAGDPQYSTTVLFFFANWCPECRAFKQAITEGEIPSSVQFLEVNFDDSAELKKRYGVTMQTTFVRVDQAGSLAKKWVGYGKNKSAQTVLENLQ